MRKTRKAPDRRARDLPLNANVAVVEVEDAYGIPEGASLERAQRSDGSQAPPHALEWRSPGQGKVEVVRNIRDPLSFMHAHGRIDDAQYHAGRRWQEIYEMSELGAIQSIDTAKEPVDGGRVPDLVTDRQIAAIRELKRAETAVKEAYGIAGCRLVRDVLGDRMSLSRAALARDSAVSHWSFILKECLNVLAGVFGYASESKKVA